jgi:hypothetical protein
MSGDVIPFVLHICGTHRKNIACLNIDLSGSKMAEQFVVSLSSRDTLFNLSPILMGFMVETVSLGQVFIRIFRFLYVSIIPKIVLRNHSSIADG